MDRTAFTEPQCLYSRAIPLLPLWAVRPVQSLSACTVDLYLYPPLWAIRPVQNLSACTRVHFTFTYCSVQNGLNKTDNVRINIKSGRIHITIFAVEEQ
jgi:hypothetical protein